MSVRIRLSAVCEDARATPEGRIDLHGVFHDLAAPGFPAEQDRLVLVAVLEWGRGDHGRHLFRADLEDEHGNSSLTVQGETDVRASPPDRPPARSHLILPMENVIFPHPGQYTFSIKVKGGVIEGPGIYLMESEPPGDLPS